MNGRPTALITRASGGIGLALAREFAFGGHDLVLVARRVEVMETVAVELRDSTGITVITHAIALSTDAGPLDLFRRVEEAGIEIDVLVNNAGTGDYGRMIELDPERLSAMLKLNVLSMTRGLASELKGTVVTVIALAPGSTSTDFVAAAGVTQTGIYRWLPRSTAEQAARAGYCATMRGRTETIPGLLNKVMAFLGELPPVALPRPYSEYCRKARTRNYLRKESP